MIYLGKISYDKFRESVPLNCQRTVLHFPRPSEYDFEMFVGIYLSVLHRYDWPQKKEVCKKKVFEKTSFWNRNLTSMKLPITNLIFFAESSRGIIFLIKTKKLIEKTTLNNCEILIIWKIFIIGWRE